jgi:DNA-binding IclR family transcriptional regulator
MNEPGLVENEVADKATAIEKALRILMSFSQDNRELTTKDISDMLGFHKATASRILLTLTDYGFLRQDPRNKTFSLGPSILKLSVALRRYLNNNIVQIAKPHIDKLRDQIKETVCLEALAGSATIMAYAAEGTYRVRLASPLGEVLPPSAAGAKAVFSHMDIEPWLRVFEKGLEPRTDKMIMTATGYREALKRTRASGIATDLAELDEGIVAIGAPVFNHNGDPIAAVVIVGLESRINTDPNSHLAVELKRVAAKISLALKCEEPEV